MLNRAEPFFALTLEQGDVAFVSKAQVAVVSCREASPDWPIRSGPRPPGWWRSRWRWRPEPSTAAVRRFELPPSRSRALDYVNTPGRFFTVWTNDLTRYFNKSLVRLIRPLD